VYYVDFYVGQEVEQTVSHTENDELLWTAAGLDLMDKTYRPTEQFASDVWYARETLQAESEYLVNQFGQVAYGEVLKFMGELLAATEGREYGTVEVRW